MTLFSIVLVPWIVPVYWAGTYWYHWEPPTVASAAEVWRGTQVVMSSNGQPVKTDRYGDNLKKTQSDYLVLSPHGTAVRPQFGRVTLSLTFLALHARYGGKTLGI